MDAEQNKDVMFRLNNGRHPLRQLCDEWLKLIKQAEDVKEQLFGQYAREAMRFFDGAHNFMWQKDYAANQGGFLSQDGHAAVGLPTFRMSVNRVFEAVALIGPALYHQNPSINVTPYTPPYIDPQELGIDPNDPLMQFQAQYLVQSQSMDLNDDKVRAKLKQYFLNRIQLTTDKKTESRWAIDEAVIKGMGLIETSLYQSSYGNMKYPSSQYLSCDDLVQDPDAKYRKDRQWVAIKRVHAVNIVEKKFKLKPGTLRGNLQSVQSANTRLGAIEAGKQKRDSKSYDLLEYWEIYSKNGIGQRLKEMTNNKSKSSIDLGQFGEYCYLAVAPDVPFPLNLPSNILQDGNEELFWRAQWPVPYWTECGSANGWPFAELAFYNTPDHVWPISLVKPGIGELRFINWCMSFLADKVAASCTSYIAIHKAMAEEIKQQLVGQSGPFKTLELPVSQGAKSIQDVISFLESPPFNKDIWTMLSEVMEQFDKRVGLTELMYGLSSKQLRSAQEADIKDKNTTIRPDKMASDVEDWVSAIALKEMECAAFKMDREDFQPFLGEVGAGVFEEKVLSQPFDRLVHQFDYRVEAGTARKPNKAAKIEQLNALGQVIQPVIMQFAMGGQIGPWNAYVKAVADAHDLDATEFLLQEPPQEPQQGMSPEDEMAMEQEKLAMERESKEAGMQMDMQAQEADMAMKQEMHQQEMNNRQQMMQLKLWEAQQKMAMQADTMAMKSEQQQQDMQQRNQMHQMDLANEAMSHVQRAKMDERTMATKEQESRAKVQATKTTAAAKAKAAAKPKPKPKPKKK